MSQALLSDSGDDGGPPAGREEAFAGFYRRWHPRLLRYLIGAGWARDAEEVAQETFARAYGRVEPERGDGATWSWLVTVSTNLAKDIRRRRRFCEVAPEADLAEAAGATTADSLVDEVYGSQCLTQLERAVETLPERHRQIWLMTVRDQCTPSEIALQLGCSGGAVSQVLRRTRRRLAGRLCGLTEGRSALVPLAVLLRGWRFARRHSGFAFPGAGAAAVGLVTAAVGLTVLVQAPSVGRPYLNLQPAELSHRLPDSPLLLRAVGLPAGSLAVRTGARSPDRVSAPVPHTTLAVSRAAYLAPHPLAPGTDATVRVTVATPLGTVTQQVAVSRNPGQGLACGRLSAVRCG